MAIPVYLWLKDDGGADIIRLHRRAAGLRRQPLGRFRRTGIAKHHRCAIGDKTPDNRRANSPTPT